MLMLCSYMAAQGTFFLGGAGTSVSNCDTGVQR